MIVKNCKKNNVLKMPNITSDSELRNFYLFLNISKTIVDFLKF